MNEHSKVQDATVASSEAPTFLEIVIDQTTSMHPHRMGTIKAFNDFIKDQKALETASCLVTMTKFSSHKVSTPYEMMDIAMVPDLTTDTFTPNGGTNLYDVISERIVALKETILETPCNVLFLVLTDGEDNQSRTGSAHTVSKMLGNKMEAGWTFVYLGAHGNALREGLRMGFPEGNIKQFAGAEMETAFAATSNATTMYRSARSSGAVAVGTTSANYFSGE